ncbi:apolipoprotein N-acyltransferase [Desulfobacterium sp. N47]|uniref:apolipoprotein N-acyltransferase n=1 Tax=Desulfobacterium sp. N47 TaxID=3115210 RepID=UPI003CC2D252
MNKSGIKIISAVISGVLLTASFPKTDLSWLAWFALVPLLASISDLGFKQSFRLGLLAGLVHYLTLLYWLSYTMGTYGHLPVYLSIPILFLFSLYLALYIAILSGLISSLCNKPLHLLFLVPVLWVCIEYLRSNFLTGFPWELIAYSQYKSLHIIQVSDIFGPYGVSFLLALSNTAFFIVLLLLTKTMWQKKSVSFKDAAISMLVFIIAFTGCWYYGIKRIKNIDETASGSEKIRISVIQGNIGQSEKWDPAFQLSTINKYVNLSLSVKAEKPDLVVWPETAAPFYFMYDKRLTEIVLDLVSGTNSSFLIGSPSFIRKDDKIEFYNSAYMLSPKANVTGKYDKSHLVPFGEYVPLKKWLPFIGKIVENVGDFNSGKKGSTISLNSNSLGVLICYELIFPYLARAQVNNGAGLLVNMTNDAWYGTTSAPYQHFSMAVFRAVENRRTLARAANTGISGFIDPAGRIIDSTNLYKDAAITRKVPILTAKTFYTRFGDLFAFACLTIAALIGLVKFIKK